MYYLTKSKFNELEKELLSLSTKGRKEIAERLDEAKSFGDLSENAEYHQARDEQGKMESRIKEIEIVLKESEIIKKHKSNQVEIGVVVVISKKGSSNEIEYEIVGKEDADVLNGKIDFHAPLVKAMMGKKEGDAFDFELPNGNIVNYKIIKIK